MLNAAYAHNAYTQTKVKTTYNPVELVIMLYDGAIEFLDKAITATTKKEIETKIKYIDKTMAIIEELHNALDLEKGGDVARNLQDLYVYMMRELVLANADNDAVKMEHIAGLLKPLREGWVSIRNTV
ncbi:MAG: flagellar export chaperone FliS [Nitrospirota bacterium]